MQGYFVKWENTYEYVIKPMQYNNVRDCQSRKDILQNGNVILFSYDGTSNKVLPYRTI